MRKIYLPLIAVMAVGSLNAQNLTKTADKPAQFAAYGAKAQTSTSPSVRGVQATLNEMFELGVPPTGWSGDWLPSTADVYEEPAAVGNTGHFAFFDAFNENPGVMGYLVTPVMQPTSGSNTLSYSVNLYNLSTNPAYQGTGAKMFIEYSTDGGTTWTTSTTNVLAGLPNYNTTTNSGWVTQTASLAAYNGMNVQARFRAVSDYGWSNIGVDNVTGPTIVTSANDIAVNPSPMVNINGFDYFQFIPNDQLVAAEFGVITSNVGSNAQTNVTLTADVNNGTFVGSTGVNNPTPSMAAGSFDTLWTNVAPTGGTGFVAYETALMVDQTETDDVPANNMADSVFFYGTDYSYYRTLNAMTTLSSYSFGTAAPAVTGMEYGATYIMPNAGRVDSITTVLYRTSGGGSVVGKLYMIDLMTGNFVPVAQTAPFTPAMGTNSALNFTTLALITPYNAAAGTLLVASIQLNITPGTDTISVVSDNAFPGDAGVAGAVYVQPAAGAFQWASVTGNVPLVGMELQFGSNGIASNVSSDEISVYPNPSNGMFTLNLGHNVTSTVEVYNVIGAQVSAKSFNTQINSLDLTGLEAGVYFVKVTTEKGQITKKINITK
ncbi:MAG: glycosyl hydrolase [Bacteroidota bacterium]|jgi:hypothetical protein|nr:glycosyl hydrolase [Bacteroidota bacterium]